MHCSVLFFPTNHMLTHLRPSQYQINKPPLITPSLHLIHLVFSSISIALPPPRHPWLLCSTPSSNCVRTVTQSPSLSIQLAFLNLFFFHSVYLSQSPHPSQAPGPILTPHSLLLLLLLIGREWLCSNWFLRYWRFHWYGSGYLSTQGLKCNGSVIG